MRIQRRKFMDATESCSFAEELLADPDRCREQLVHAQTAYHQTGSVPAPDGAFPAWEFTTSTPSPGRSSSAVGSEAEGATLRAVGRVRLARPQESPYTAVAEVAFRGSRNAENWITNLTADLAPLSCSSPSEAGVGAQVHRGWQEAYLALRGVMLAMIADGLAALGKDTLPDFQVLAVLTGHSLGGALATLAAYDIAVFCGYDVQCVTWASPRVGDAAFVAAYNAAVKKTARFLTRLDVVPRLPVNPSDQNDDGAVLGVFRSALAAVTSSATGKMLGVSGYHHVCKGTVLDDNGGGAGPADDHFAEAAPGATLGSQAPTALPAGRRGSSNIVAGASNLLLNGLNKGLKAGAAGVISGQVAVDMHKLSKYAEMLERRWGTCSGNSAMEAGAARAARAARHTDEEDAELQEAMRMSLIECEAAVSAATSTGPVPSAPRSDGPAESAQRFAGQGIILGPR